MEDVQKTMSITEALNERIEIIQEEIELYENERKGLQEVKFSIMLKRSVMGIMVALALPIGTIFVIAADGNNSALFLGFMCWGLSILLIKLMPQKYDKKKVEELTGLVNRLIGELN